MASDTMLHQTFQYPRRPSLGLSQGVSANQGILLFDDASMTSGAPPPDLTAAAERHQGTKRPAEDDFDGEQRLAKRFDLMQLGDTQSH